MWVGKYGTILLIVVFGLIWNGNARATDEAEIWTKGSVAAVQNLINRTGNLNLPDQDGDTPLILASKLNSGEVIELLIQHGADPNLVKPPMMYTPLMFAALYNPEPETAITTLAANGAYIDAQDKNGKTALIHAAAHNEKNNVATNRGRAVISLLQANADPFTKDKYGLLANDYGQKNNILINSRARALLAQYSDPSNRPYYATNPIRQTKPLQTAIIDTQTAENATTVNDKQQRGQRAGQSTVGNAGINITIVSGDQHNISNSNGQQTIASASGDQIIATGSQVNTGGQQTVATNSQVNEAGGVQIVSGDTSISTSFIITVTMSAGLVLSLVIFCIRHFFPQKKR